MKHKNNDVLIGMLIFLLLVSVSYNLFQDSYINKLIEEIENLEYAQSLLTSEISRLDSDDVTDDGDDMSGL